MTNEIIIAESSGLAYIRQPALDENPFVVYITGLASEHSRRNMKRHLNMIAGMLTNGQCDALQIHWGGLRYAHTMAIRSRLLELYPSPATVNMMLSALRGVLLEAWRLGHMTAENYHRAVDIKNVEGSTIPAGRDLSAEEIGKLVESCADGSKAGQRDAAIIGLLYSCGLRRSEVVKLNVADFAPGTGKLKIYAAKGRKDRTVYAQGGALDALLDWMHIRGWDSGALFLPIQKNNKFVFRRLSPQTIYDILVERAKSIGLEHFTVHDFRRTFVGDSLERGVDIATVANIAGHASVDTTRRYDRRPEETKREAAAKLHYPYKKK